MAGEDESQPGNLPKEKIVHVYGKDLHSDHFTIRTRIPTDGFEHGDTIKITAELLEETDGRETNPGNGPEVQE